MKRFVMKKLYTWKNSPYRKPLILNGIRQVGKTWLLKEFGATCYNNTVYINFEDAPQLQTLFLEDFDIQRILNVLEVYTRTQIVPGKRLIIFDEIQAAESNIQFGGFIYF